MTTTHRPGYPDLEQYVIQEREYWESRDPYLALEFTTLEDIGFDGDILHIDGASSGQSLPYEPDEWYSAPISEELRKGREAAFAKQIEEAKELREQERERWRQREVEQARLAKRVFKLSRFADEPIVAEIIARIIARYERDFPGLREQVAAMRERETRIGAVHVLLDHEPTVEDLIEIQIQHVGKRIVSITREPTVAEMIAQDERDFPELRRPRVDYKNPVEPEKIAVARNEEQLARYLLKRACKYAPDIAALWRWFNTRNVQLENMTPNYALLNGRSDVAWTIMQPMLRTERRRWTNSPL